MPELLNKQFSKRAPGIFLIMLATLLFSNLPVYAQPVDGENRRSVDIMVVLDNSCSMFPAGMFPTSICANPPGNDAQFLRIHGTNLFLAALGLGEANENDYQLGIIEFGDTARTISPLQPLTRSMRGDLARTIANPSPIPFTDMEEAMELAYDSLRNSPNRKPTNLPAVVLITDGIPDKSGSSGVDSLIEARNSIGQIVRNNADIPLFIMLLKGNEDSDYITLYEEYITFWQELRNENDQLFVYLIEDASQIDETYNQIISQLQNTVSTPSLPVVPGEPLKVFVNQYVQRLVIKVDHGIGSTGPRGTVTVTDPKNNTVSNSDRGVDRFSHPDNPWETIVIGSDRLDWDDNGDGVFDLKDDFWVIESDQPVSVFIDLRDAYRFNFLEPEITLVDVGLPNVYLATNRQSPIKSLVIRFNLLDKANNIIFDSQPITGKVLHPDGSEAELRIPAGLTPDGSGTYEIIYDYASTYTGSLDGLNRFTFSFQAGASEIIGGSPLDPISISNPVAVSRLLVDVGRGAYIESVAPLLCAAGQTTEIQVAIGDYEYSNPATMRVRLFDGTQDIMLSDSGNGGFNADVTSLCQPLANRLACSTSTDATWTVSLVAQTLEGYPVQSRQVVPVRVEASPCTPTPTPSPTPTPTPPPPTPTPIPDRDGDGGNDLVDQCPDQPGFEMFGWCPVPWWLWALLGGLVLATGAFIFFYMVPLVKVQRNKPAKAYLEVLTKGRPGSRMSVYEAGMTKRQSAVTIGSSKKAAMQVPGLKPFEYVVIREGDDRVRVYPSDDKGQPIRTGGRTISTEQGDKLPTSQSDIELRISLGTQKSASGTSRPNKRN